MASLDVKVHNKNFASIKDLEEDIDIRNIKWNSLFEALTKISEGIYFKGDRAWLENDEFDQTLSYLSEYLFIDRGKNHSEILFRLKTSSLMYNRKLVSQMWDYYEYPCFILLSDKEHEDNLIQSFENNGFYEEMIKNDSDIIIMYRSFEPDVLWIKSSIEVEKILHFL